MSQHPPAPAIGGPPRTQQWPRSHIFPSTSMPSSLATHLPFSQDISSAHQPQDNGNQPYNYNDLTNINMTSSLPGLGGPVTGIPLPPPPFPFMGQFTPSQFNPPSFPPIQMPPLRYPPLSIPAANIQAPSRPSSGDLRSQANSVSINDADSRAARTPITRKDYDREEGELTDMEMTMPTSSENAGLAETRDDAIPSTLTQQNGYTTGTCNTTTLTRDKESRRSPAAKSCDPSTLDLEEGEASSTGSHISARESESRMRLGLLVLDKFTNFAQRMILQVLATLTHSCRTVLPALHPTKILLFQPQKMFLGRTEAGNQWRSFEFKRRARFCA